MSQRRSSLRNSFVLGASGLVGLLGMLDKPSLANIRAVDAPLFPLADRHFSPASEP
jgi:hypothetical protein